MHAQTRAIVRCTVLLVAVYLTVDIATPLLPGAFRFDPRQSVDATGRAGQPALTPAPAARAERVLVEPGGGSRQPSPRSAGPAMVRFARVLHPPDTEGSPGPSADDD